MGSPAPFLLEVDSVQYISVTRSQIASLPKAVRVAKRPVRWSIDGHEGRFQCGGPHCLYENLSSTYREFSDRNGGLPIQDGYVLASVGRRVYQFKSEEE